MAKHALTDIAADQLEQASASSDGHSSVVLVGDDAGSLQQTVVALTEGNTIEARDSADNTTMQVLTGSVRVRTASGPEDVCQGDLVEIPTEPHVIRAEEDTTVLLTESSEHALGRAPQQ